MSDVVDNDKLLVGLVGECAREFGNHYVQSLLRLHKFDAASQLVLLLVVSSLRSPSFAHILKQRNISGLSLSLYFHFHGTESRGGQVAGVSTVGREYSFEGRILKVKGASFGVVEKHTLRQ